MNRRRRVRLLAISLGNGPWSIFQVPSFLEGAPPGIKPRIIHQVADQLVADRPVANKPVADSLLPKACCHLPVSNSQSEILKIRKKSKVVRGCDPEMTEVSVSGRGLGEEGD